MERITKTVTCDNCDKDISDFEPVKVEVFDIRIRMASYTFPFTDFCSLQCFVEKLIKFLNFKFRETEECDED